MIFRPWVSARGNRPAGPFRLNRASSQARGLVGWWPLTGNTVLRDYVADRNLRLNPGVQADSAIRSSTLGGTIAALGVGSTGAGSPALSQGVSALDAAFQFTNSALGGTVSCWVRPKTTGSGSTNTAVVACWDGVGGYMFFVGSAGTDVRFYCASQNTGAYSIPFTDPSRWYLLTGVLTRGASDTILYVDGRRVSAAGAGDASTITSQYLEWGSYNGTQGAFGDFDVTDTRIWQVGLTDADVWALYDPATRWDLYAVPSTRTFFLPTTAVTGNRFLLAPF